MEKTNSSCISVQNAAYAAIVISCVATCGALLAALKSTSTLAILFFGCLAVVACGFAVSSIMAYCSSDSRTAEAYFNNVWDYSKTAVITIVIAVTAIFVQGAVSNAAGGNGRTVRLA